METTNRLLLTFLLNSAWQVTLVAGVAALGARLARSAPARYRHGLWVIALGLSVLLPLASVHNVELQEKGVTVRNSSSHLTQPVTLPQSAGPTRRNTVRAAGPNGATGLFSWQGRWRRPRPVSLPPTAAYAVVGCYLLFLLLGSIRLWNAWRRTRAIRRTAYRREMPEAMASIVARCRAALGLEDVSGRARPAPGKPLVSILCSAEACGPLTLGARRPAIVLPESLFPAASSEDLSAALCHEMAHIRRHDFLLNLICELAYLPISFHPAARLVKRRIDETRELACDELAAGQVVTPSTYARSLVSLARTMSGFSSLAPASGLAGSGYTLGVFDANILEERIMRLLDKRPRASARLAKLTLLAGALVLAGSCLAASAFSLSIVQEKETDARHTLQAFTGIWQDKFHGEPFVNLVLTLEDGKMTGTLSRFSIKTDESGNLVETEGGEEVGWHVVQAKLEHNALTLRCQDEQSGEVSQFELKLTRDNDIAEFRPLGAPVPVKPWKMARTSPTGSMAVGPVGPVEGVGGGVINGVPGGAKGGVIGGVSGVVSGGAAGGVINGVPGGAKGGVIGGVPGGVQRRGEQAQVSISGTVSDPSEARVPGAFVSVVNVDTGLKYTTVADDAGEYSFASLPPGHYRVEANQPGFAVYRGKEYALEPGLAAPVQDIVQDIVLEPGSVLQAVEVTAKAPSGSLASAGERGGVAKGAPRRIRVGGLIQTTKLLSSKKPEYPEGPRAKGIQGVVLLEAVISKEGEPLGMKVVSSPDPELSKAAMDAVREWRYDSTLLNGEPIEVVTTVAVRFRLAP